MELTAHDWQVLVGFILAVLSAACLRSDADHTPPLRPVLLWALTQIPGSITDLGNTRQEMSESDGPDWSVG